MTKQDDREETELNVSRNEDETTELPEHDNGDEAASKTANPPKKIRVDGADNAKLVRKLNTFLATKKGKVAAAILSSALVLLVLMAIPLTRYGIVGTFLKKDVAVTVLDSESSNPVSGAMVSLEGGFTATTDAKGVATIQSVPVGSHTLKIDKKYYLSSSSDYLVPILSAPVDTRPVLKATGRSIEITVTNKITNAGVAGASLTISDSTVTTDEKGVANIILPVKDSSQSGTIKAGGYNDSTFETKVDNKDGQKLNVPITAAGKIFFLSKRTGKINVMKSDLDGMNAEVVAAGTGQESDSQTVLLSTTDWKYLALLASRDSGKTKLYLIDTSSGKLTTIDEGLIDYRLIGWSGRQFAYQAVRSYDAWVNKRQALKSYNADTGKLVTLDETQGSGLNFFDYSSQGINNQYIVGGKLLYTKSWDAGQYGSLAGRQSSIMSVDVGGGNKKSLKDLDANHYRYFDAKLYKPTEIYFRASATSDAKPNYFYDYEDGKVSQTTETNDTKFYNTIYPTYLISPSGKKTVWYEPRDGKNVIFIGDENSDNAKEVGVGDFTPYGWYTDDYILFSKGGSQLFILGAKGEISTASQPLRVTDYHKPALSYSGYGSGYGGL